MLNFGRVNPHYGCKLPSSRGKIRTFNSFMVQVSRFARQVLGEMPSESWDCWVLQELLSTNSFSAEGNGLEGSFPFWDQGEPGKYYVSLKKKALLGACGHTPPTSMYCGWIPPL